MIYESYARRIYDKLQTVNSIYVGMAYKPVGELSDVEYVQTTEKLHSNIPTDGYTAANGAFVWGGQWQNLWIKGKAVAPQSAEGKALYVMPKTGAVEILYFRDGKPAGIINSKGEDVLNGQHAVSLIADNVKAGDTFDIALECYAGHYCVGCGPYDSYGSSEPGDDAYKRRYEKVELCVRDEDVFGFIFDLKAVLQLSDLERENSVKAEARNVLEKVAEAVCLYPLHYPEEKWRASLVECRKLMSEILSERGSDKTRGYVGIIGHSHMDTAWLWPVAETVRKCARTYANALQLMDIDPDYKFIQSSALHLDWMRRYYPAIFEGIVRRQAEGRYEPNGGVWVECDCNITSGELMVRQFLYGQSFTRKYMNYTSDAFWLPDTFGYNAAIPQIMRGCEVKYFYTTKMSWNDLNEFPYDTFVWRGLDGSEVITHLNIMHTFPDVANIHRAANAPKDKQAFDGKLLAFGFGDGGGGPTMGMLEDAKRVRELTGMPKVEYTTVSDFMKKIEKDSHDLPVYNGELYLELHRGTLTQMHDIKRNNRKAEFALHDMEFMAVAAKQKVKAKIDELYKVLLTNQFHDILPGTSITPVNELARAEVTGVIKDAKISSNASAKSLTDSSNSVTLFNTTSFDRDYAYLTDIDGTIAGAKNQRITDVCGRELLAVGGLGVEALGAKSFEITDAPVCSECSGSPFKLTGDTLETPYYTAQFDRNGAIASLITKDDGRQICAEAGNPLNTFWCGEDVPRSYDDWDLDSDTVDLKLKPDMRLCSRETAADGALEYRIRSTYAIGEASKLTQDMIFRSDSPRIDFHTLIDWNEKHTFLKAGFDVNVMAQTVKNEIQFGHMERPTTRNTSLEAAKFEVVNHKWTDVSESRQGVALLNDCKYGISCEALKNGGTSLRLSLHKSGTHPDVTGDKGIHELTYSLFPHTGAFAVPTVVREAYLLNVPALQTSGRCDFEPIVKLGASNIVCEAVKPAENDENAYVVRLYEAERSRTKCCVTFKDAKEACVTNMLEDIISPLELSNGCAELEFKPFEIKTILVKR